MHPARLLVVDDDREDRELISEFVRLHCPVVANMTGVRGLSEARSALSMSAYDLVLLDLNLGPTEGLETLREFRRTAPRQPFIVLTGMAENDDFGISCVKAGAHDYVDKSKMRGELPRAIEYALLRLRAFRPHHAAEARAQDSRDALETLVRLAADLLGTTGEGEAHRRVVESTRVLAETKVAPRAVLSALRRGGPAGRAIEFELETMICLAEAYGEQAVDGEFAQPRQEWRDERGSNEGAGP